MPDLLLYDSPEQVDGAPVHCRSPIDLIVLNCRYHCQGSGHRQSCHQKASFASLLLCATRLIRHRANNHRNLLRVRTLLFDACIDFEAYFFRENARDNVSLLLQDKSCRADALPMLFLDALSMETIRASTRTFLGSASAGMSLHVPRSPFSPNYSSLCDPF